MITKGTRVIVTGGAGVIGRELVGRLDAAGARVRCFDIAPRPASFTAAIEYCQRDLATLNPLEFIAFEPEILFHLAAVFERTEEAAGFWNINFTNETVQNHAVADAARACVSLQHFIFASSYLVYDPDTYCFVRPHAPVALSETVRLNPRNLCGATKLYAEKELSFLERTGAPFRVTAARIFRVYGRGSRDVISRWVRAAIAGEPLTVYQPENKFDYIYAGDVADGLLRLANVPDAPRIVNLGSGRSHSVAQVLRTLQAEFPKLRTVSDSRSERFESSQADLRAFTRAVHWRPATGLAEGIRDLVTYEKRKR